ncbi:MAG: dTMP kinase [Candidatus Nanohaloarchaeota archaeon QJJ-5]|nr:dTMP kinase [Candidatus Nanohaloarchaeota archaeon QJJ-5]
MRTRDYPGRFIVIEGADGAGTTTQSKQLADELDAHWTYEPSGNKIGKFVDTMISGDDFSPEAIALGFAADRMAHLEEEILPRLEKGRTVVCDRYYHSSFVYQPILGADRTWVEELNKHALVPDQTVILDIAAEEGMERVSERGHDGNIFEDLSFQQKVVIQYQELVEDLEEDITLVDASQPIDAVFADIIERIEK